MESTSEALFGISEQRLTKMRRYRKLKDQVAARLISVGGISVIFAICLIFFYLLYEVLPLFLPASIKQTHSLDQYTLSQPYFSVVEEQGQVGLAVTAAAGPVFYRVADGQTLLTPELPTATAHERLAVIDEHRDRSEAS